MGAGRRTALSTTTPPDRRPRGSPLHPPTSSSFPSLAVFPHSQAFGTPQPCMPPRHSFRCSRLHALHAWPLFFPHFFSWQVLVVTAWVVAALFLFSAMSEDRNWSSLFPATSFFAFSLSSALRRESADDCTYPIRAQSADTGTTQPNPALNC
jgi:hypothetical protein